MVFLFSFIYLPTENEALSKGATQLTTQGLQISPSLPASLYLSVMDFCRNVQVSGGLPSEYEQEQLFPPSCSKLGSLDDLFSGNTTEEGDVHLEWLSIFVEDCLSSSGNCLPPTAAAALPPQNVQKNNASNNNGNTIIPKAAATSKLPLQVVKSQKQPSSILHRFVIPGKARSKRSRGGPIGSKTRSSANFTSWSHHLQMTAISDPPLLQQAYWLADSELILPKTEENKKKPKSGEIIHEENKEEEEMNNVMVEKEEDMLGSLGGSNGQQGQPRRCTHCLSQRTPQWRAGPLGPKTLCNACGVRYKSGRLLPEYRPAKSPTFVSYKHSNSHKKVLEMRTMSLLSSDS